MRFEILPRGTYRANLDGFTVDVWKMGGGLGAYSVFNNTTQAYVGGRVDCCSFEDATIEATDVWRENAHPIN